MLFGYDAKVGLGNIRVKAENRMVTLKYNPRYALRCANGNTTWWVSEDGKYGVNVLTTVEVK